MHRTRSTLLAAALAGTLALTGAGAAHAAVSPQTQTPQTQAFRNYVALGDSYTAGPLVPLQRLDPLTCFRSTNNYPAWLADSLGLGGYTDASCSGARTTDFAGSQSIPFGSAPPQFDRLRADTDLVTVGIGGNDFSLFGNLISVCPELRDQDPTGSPCREKYTVEGIDTMKQNTVQIQARVTEVLRGVHQRSPAARVVLVGYPRVAPASGTCPDVLPFADGDVPWVDSVEQALNGALAGAAAADGATTWVDPYARGLGHDACAGDQAWVQGKNFDVFAAYSFHPRKAGMIGVADTIADALGVPSARRANTPASTGGLPATEPRRAAESLVTAGGTAG